MKILLTGSSGLIGHNLKYHLANEHRIFSCDLKQGGDCRDLIHKKDKMDIDQVIHAASYCHIRSCIKYPMIAHLNNAEGSMSVFEFARRNDVKEVILFSSSRVLSPETNIYTATKKYSEELAKAYHRCYGIDYKIIRPSTVYGLPDDTERIVPEFIRLALIGQPLVIYGDRFKTLDMTYIDDFLKAYDIIIERGKKNTSFDVGSGFSLYISSLAENIISLTASSSKIIYQDKELEQPQQVCIDTKSMDDLGYSPEWNISDALKVIIKRFMSQ